MFADGTPTPYEGWDCFGLVACGALAAGGPDLRTWWTDRAWLELLPVANPSPGDLALYGTGKPGAPQDVEHVEVLLELVNSLGAWRTIGAAGGDHTVTTLARAELVGARVRRRNSHLERRNFAGFRRLVLKEAA